MIDPVAQLTEALAKEYRIERELGAGGMATVYLAHDLRHDRRVAIKVLRPELAAALGAERFLREITTTANLRHPHILPLYDSGQAGDLLYYVMPLVEGESLRTRLEREKQLPLEDALEIAREVADALSYAHARGVIHRDIKPDNILLESGHAVVADFGIARALTAVDQVTLTQTGLAMGTPQYMSPEQAAGEGDIDGRSDLYALGCVLFEMLAGQAPFTGPTTESVVRQHLVAEPPDVTRYRPAVPAEVSAALQRALAKNPADRFNPVAQFAEVLRHPAGTAAYGAAAMRGRGSKWKLAGGAVLVLAAAAAIGLLLRGPSVGDRPPVIGSTTKVTLEPGLEVDPALSPDGQMVAYAAGTTSNMQIVVRQVAGGRTVALTSDSTKSFRWPRWSPDGTQIAYQGEEGIYLVPALGGVSRLLAAVEPIEGEMSSSQTTLSGLAWSPDGRRIVFLSAYGSGRAVLVDVERGDTSSIPVPRDAHSPAWSPDGSMLAMASGNPTFVFGMIYFANVGPSSIWTVPIDGSPPNQITDGTSMDASPQWGPTGRHLWFLSDQGGSRDGYRIALSRTGQADGAPVRVTTGLDAHTISLSPDGNRLAWSRLDQSTNIWALPIPARGEVSASNARPITTGSQVIESMDLSRDGRALVFDSDRSQNAEIYRMSVTGGEPIQLTRDPAGDYAPAWSHDGQWIAFHSLRTGNRDIFTMKADGTGLVQRTDSPHHEQDTTWAPDGRALVAEQISLEGESVRWTSRFLIVPLDSGNSSPGTPLEGAGDFAIWSPAGDQIAYHAVDGIRILSPAGGADHLLASNAADGTEAFYAAWSPDGGTMYYLAQGTAGWMIRAISRNGGPSRVLVRFDDPARQPAGYGFATDGRTFYLTMGSRESDIMVGNLAPPR